MKSDGKRSLGDLGRGGNSVKMDLKEIWIGLNCLRKGSSGRLF
jgi:hypothetical protein